MTLGPLNNCSVRSRCLSRCPLLWSPFGFEFWKQKLEMLTYRSLWNFKFWVVDAGWLFQLFLPKPSSLNCSRFVAERLQGHPTRIKFKPLKHSIVQRTLVQLKCSLKLAEVFYMFCRKCMYIWSISGYNLLQYLKYQENQVIIINFLNSLIW